MQNEVDLLAPIHDPRRQICICRPDSPGRVFLFGLLHIPLRSPTAPPPTRPLTRCSLEQPSPSRTSPVNSLPHIPSAPSLISLTHLPFARRVTISSCSHQPCAPHEVLNPGNTLSMLCESWMRIWCGRSNSWQNLAIEPDTQIYILRTCSDI